MKKIILDMNIPQSKAEVQTFLKTKFAFPDYYGKNLDALYDELTSITEPVAVGFFMPYPDLADMDIDLMVYIDRVRETFLDAEADNPNLAVIVGELPESGIEDWEEDGENWDDLSEGSGPEEDTEEGPDGPEDDWDDWDDEEDEWDSDPDSETNV